MKALTARGHVTVVGTLLSCTTLLWDGPLVGNLPYLFSGLMLTIGLALVVD